MTRYRGFVTHRPNRDLLKLWDRAEDRLEKIRTCRNINGERMDLALFAPEIDPMALVRAKAAGLSLGDLLASASGNLPPYRFSFLLSKARDYAGLLQSFGARLQSAIERRDAEEMALLRATQAADMQRLITKVRERELELAEAALEEAKRRRASVDYKRKYYQGKLDEGPTGAEIAYQLMGQESISYYLVSTQLKGVGGIFHLVPQLGALTAMTFGGKELGDSAKAFGEVASGIAKRLELMSKSAKMEVDFQKQIAEFKHQAKQGDNELKEIDQRIKAAEIRVEMAQHALKMHERSISDHEEMLELFGSRFTNLDFYTWLTSEMQMLHRRAFNAALSMTRLAERAYRFERPQDEAPLLDATVWSASRAGFGAGERLTTCLVEMEKRYIETNYRSLEVSQPFSLGLIAPAELAALRNTGACDFTLPELAFDLFYPGQYRRRIRAVRVTISCAVGPHTNIPATLTLTGSKLRLHPTPAGADGLSDSPLRHSVTIATSTAQADTGVLDFSFSDPRYVPFEGAGAVDSEWRLNLPTAFRAFDYNSITDVVLHISYSAEYDVLLRDRIETANTNLQNALIDALRQNMPPAP